jgi:hypothetical protein
MAGSWVGSGCVWVVEMGAWVHGRRRQPPAAAPRPCHQGYSTVAGAGHAALESPQVSRGEAGLRHVLLLWTDLDYNYLD